VHTKTSRSLPGWFLVVGIAAVAFCCGRIQAQTQAETQTQAPKAVQRITQAVDEKNLVLLKGNVPSLALARFDQGAVADAYPLHRILLLLQRGPDQEAALSQFMEQQQDKSSPNFHAWLTPQQFGQQFGPSDADIRTITTWLQSHGFQITNITAGRTLIEFSGTAGQVRSAFHTQIHNYLVNGEVHTANATDLQIPAALAPVVVGPVSLNNFPVTSYLRRLGAFYRPKGSSLAKPLGKPLYTLPGCIGGDCFGLGPADFGTIYNSASLLSGSPKIDGTGQTIAIVGETDIDPTDVTDFQSMFGMTPNFSAANNIIVNGADPGVNDSESESDLDVQWASAVAPGATVKFVTSQPTETTAGIFLSAIYIVENNFAGVMSESFGGCEQQIGTLNQFHNTLWEQAAAQGITVFLSAGDGGSAGCDNFDTAQTATQGLAVSGFASTPFNVAVGGTDFDEINKWSQYWSSTNNSPSQSSALSYIPEIPWNENCAQLGLTGCGASAPNGSLNIVAGGGGVSILYAKPSWQSGAGVPNDGHRDLPDVSLFASPGFDGSFYIICQKDVTDPPESSCNLSELGYTFQGIGGTSASAPAFAGIMALVDQSQGGRQGNANYALYSLFKQQANANPAINCNSSATPSTSCTFYDITRGNSGLTGAVGTNSVPCTPGSLNCSSTKAGQANGVLVSAAGSSTEAYTVSSGYDLATGLGSVNVANLVANWSSGLNLKPSSTSLSATVSGQAATSISGITHGTPINLSSAVAPGQGATGTPTGAVSLLATPNPNPTAPGASLGFDVLTLSNGTATGNSIVLPGGQYNLTAHYQGDGTFNSSDSSPGIPVNISAEPSKTLISIPTFNPTTGQETANTPASIVYGSPYIARMDVGNTHAVLSYPPQAVCTPPACPTGSISWTDSLNGAPATPLDGGTFVLNTQGFTEDQPINLAGGSHVLNASYAGDDSFGASSASYSVTVTPAPTTTTIDTNDNSPIGTVGVPFNLNMATDTHSSGAVPSGTYTVYDAGTAVNGTSNIWNGQTGTFSTVGAFDQATVTFTFTTPGHHVLTASYSGDANYAPSTTAAPYTVNVNNPTTTAMTASSTNIIAGNQITLTALVDTAVKSPTPGNNVQFYSTGDGYYSGNIQYTSMTDANGNAELQATLVVTPFRSGQIWANFNGDADYALSSSMNTAVNLTVTTPDFSVNPTQLALTIPAGQSASAPLTVTPATNLSSQVNFIVQGSGYAPGMNCAVTPNPVNLSGQQTANTTFGCSVPVPSSNTTTSVVLPLVTDPPSHLTPSPWNWWNLLVDLCLLVIALWTLRSAMKVRRLAALVFVSSLFLVLIGCGGGGSSSIGGGGGGSAPPTPTSISMSVASTKVASLATVTATANVTGSQAPTGTVTIFDSTTGFGLGTQNLVNGQAQVSWTFGGVGAHALIAKYSGDAKNQASQTQNPLTLVVTGTTPGVYLTAGTGTDVKQINVTLTVQ